MAKATKASPVKVSFEFDCAAFLTLESDKGAKVAAQIRMVHSAIRPGVTHADIAARINEYRAHAVSTGDTSHMAQTAALAIGSQSALTSPYYADDEALFALWKVRTTGTKDERVAMVAAYVAGSSPFDSFADYVAAWASDVRAAKTASRSASADKSTAQPGTAKGKNSGADKPADKAAEVTVPASFKAALAALDSVIAAESDPAVLAEWAKALQVRVNRCKAPSVKPAPAKVPAAA